MKVPQAEAAEVEMERMTLDVLALRVAIFLQVFAHAAVSDLEADTSPEAVERSVALGYIKLDESGPVLTDTGVAAIQERRDNACEDDAVTLIDFRLFSFVADENGPIGPKPRH